MNFEYLGRFWWSPIVVFILIGLLILMYIGREELMPHWGAVFIIAPLCIWSIFLLASYTFTGTAWWWIK